MSPGTIIVGTAGWSIPRPSSERAPGEGSQLERYARVFRGVEINSSFHRPHAASTYARWAAGVPPGFRFAVKLPRAITHDLRLRRSRSFLDAFLEQSAGLGAARGPLLVQLPPSFAFDRRAVSRFFALLRDRVGSPVACEPRHESWASPAAEAVMRAYRIARVAADPPRFTGADVPGGWSGLVYYRLHGTPRTYWSRYAPDYVSGLAGRLVEATAAADAWCIFDNTASGAAFENAWELQAGLAGG